MMYFILGIVLLILILGFDVHKKISTKTLKYTVATVLILSVMFALYRFGQSHLAWLFGGIAALFPLIRRLIGVVGIIQSIRRFTQKNTPASSTSQMTLHEARDILSVSKNASKEDIMKAYHKLMKQNHPDKGGSKYLAIKINKAKDVLIAHLRGDKV